MSPSACEPLGSEEGMIGGALCDVADHAAVDDVCEVALEDPAGLLLGVAAGARVFVERLRPLLTTQLGDSHQVQGPVDAAGAAGGVAVGAARGGGGWSRGTPPIVNRRGSPTSTSSSATSTVERPHSSPSVEPDVCTSAASSAVTCLSSASSLAIRAR